MVRVILDGRKTQTRRVVKGGFPNARPGNKLPSYLPDERYPDGEIVWQGPLCPYGKPGDRLWVREAFRVETDGDEQYVTFAADGRTRHNPKISEKWSHDQAVAFGDVVHGPYTRPSIHMPRFISRIDLEITKVRVERLQDISEDDATAEGVTLIPLHNNDVYGETNREAFERLWDKINGKKYPWNSNPWVWVIEFRKI